MQPTRDDRMKMQTLITRYNGICVYCRKPVDPTASPPTSNAPSRDHFIPRSKGGSRGLHNTVLACVSCNQDKGNMDPRMILAAWIALNPESFIAAVALVVEILDAKSTTH